ncbi:MAG: chromate transporter [Lachnospiraceae bacterium]|nr:chromate transporter [Lachnospiraceae bacterium]
MLQKKNLEQLWILFKSMFLLSACTFGGGFVIVSLMKKKFVEELKWLEEDEMLDITAITQSSPGPLPVNASVIIGYRMQGIPGSLAAVLGTILPPMFVISLICVFYTEFRQNLYIAAALQVMRAGVAAVILDVTWNLAKNVWNSHSVFYTSLMVLSFCGAYFFGVSAMIIILICLVIGITEAVLTSNKKKGVTGNESFN